MTTARSTRHDAMSLLKEDHKKAQKLFKEFEKADEDAQPEIVAQACQELTLHAQLEEEIFYPAVRDAMEDADLMEEAHVEHKVAKQLIAELQQMDASDAAFAATFKVLGEYVKHHIEEEEGSMFPKVKKAKLDLVALGEQLMQRKEALQTGSATPTRSTRRRPRQVASARHP